MQDPVFDVHLVEPQRAGLGRPQAVPEHHKEQTAVAGLVAAALRGAHELVHFKGGQVLPIIVHALFFFLLPGAFSAQASFCPVMGLLGGPQTRIKLGVDFWFMDKRRPFVHICRIW